MADEASHHAPRRPPLSWRFAAAVGLIVISDDGWTYRITPYGRSFE